MKVERVRVREWNKSFGLGDDLTPLSEPTPTNTNIYSQIEAFGLRGTKTLTSTL